MPINITELLASKGITFGAGGSVETANDHPTENPDLVELRQKNVAVGIGIVISRDDPELLKLVEANVAETFDSTTDSS